MLHRHDPHPNPPPCRGRGRVDRWAAMTLSWGCAVAMLLAPVTEAAPVDPSAKSAQIAEQKIEAGMIYNFLKYTDWPSLPTTNAMVVCIAGTDPFAGNLQLLQDRSVNLRPIDIRSLSDPAKALECDLLVVDPEQPALWAALRDRIHGRSILTVGMTADFVREGGMLAFSHGHGHIAITLNRAAMKAAHLRPQQRLLNLVTVDSEGS